jgi:serine/threonine protein kinase
MSANQSEFEGLLVFGKYKIIRKIGAGSFGVCYEGIDTTSGQKFAIKAESIDSKDKLMRHEITFYMYFLRNINGIPKIYCYGNEMGINLMVLQLLGDNLEQLFKSCNKQFSLKTVFMLAEQMIARIESIHSKYLIHRDLKPENFLMGIKDKDKKKLFLIDFGITKPFMDRVTKKHIPFSDGKSVIGMKKRNLKAFSKVCFFFFQN